MSAPSTSAAGAASSAAPPGKLSRSEFRRQKDLEEDRKAGRAPAELDEDGNIINPHVPSYMAQAPWYMDTGSRSLKHQKKPIDPNAVKAGINDWYQRGSSSVGDEVVAKKFRKGACENCGSMSHKTRDCLERPRKKGAKKLGKTLAGDHALQEVAGLDYAAKRDRWNGYDPSSHKKVVEEFEAIEAERRRLKEEQIDNATSSDLKHAKRLAQKQSKSTDPDALDFSSDDSDDSDDEKYADKADAVGQKVDNRMTIRNLRIREDRAKYLYNLDVNSAYYDPKTRTMREAPNPNVRPEDAEYAGDNFARAQGSESGALANLQLFSWQAEARGNDLNLQANPTANEQQFREFQQRKEKLREQTKGSILDKYGGAEHFDALPRELLTGQTEQYVEYNQAGKVVKGLDKVVPKSRWEEDVLENNHTQVWGSWFYMEAAEWGYACCRSRVWNSYCTGEAGIEASKTTFAPKPRAEVKEVVEKETKQSKKRERKRERSASVSSSRSRSRSVTPSDDSSSDSGGRHRRRHSRRSHRHRSRSPPSKSTYVSRKDLGNGDVSSRLDRSALQRAIEEERAKQDPALAAKLAEEKQRRFEALPDWVKDAERINAKVNGSRRERGGETEVTEEQLEAYRLVNRDGKGGVSEDPMANYRDEEDV
ncbi:Pre-mRNA splicing Prp18-interacting factor [Kalmanozyma brasiliensis GHG001]|uniref:Pre-mRNA-splicing factor SLU7 n=1 Tax=Kalmanozyma brasiliensis (strain GHG001) TaxID=1365824 RepID=V5F1N5_KALBG|nr:Pre-mRNA splicing Prp18-interacting factor [Kalmanozyma brasiliensis GHG001]EST09219.1 Pre-mRNA splicing Prp18-interacting factor [Kalmanozyma brasiliensis GHG001]